MSVTVRDWLPGVAAQIDALAQLPAIALLNQSIWLFSLVETAHLLAMAMLGGAVLILNLRLLGVALPSLSPADVEQAARPWLIAGIAGTIVTGAIMTLATTASTLVSAAFGVKIIALVAAILLSVTVGQQVRSGAASGRSLSRYVAAIAGALWLLSLFLFASTRNLGAGSLLVATAGFALVAVFIRSHRALYLGGIAVILGVGLGGTFLLPATAEGDVLVVRISVFALVAAATWAAALLLRERRLASWHTTSAATLGAFGSTLAWVTVAAAGRWIGFS